MPQTLQIQNFGRNNVLEATKLASQANVGAATLQLQNTADAGNDMFAILGTLGSSNAELVLIDQPVDSQQITLQAPIKLPHGSDEPLTYLFGDQINIYRAPINEDGSQPADDQFALITSPINLDPNQALTPFTDPDGGGDYWYKVTFVNSNSSNETSLAYATARRGDQNRHYCTLAQIRQEAGFANSPYVTDLLIDEKRQVAEAEADSTINAVCQLPLPQPTNPNVTQAVVQIAAGLLMQAQYGTMNPSLSAQGSDKIAEGRATLSLIATKVLILQDANYNDLTLDNSANSPGFYPETSGGLRPVEGRSGGPNVTDKRMFNIGDRY